MPHFRALLLGALLVVQNGCASIQLTPSTTCYLRKTSSAHLDCLERCQSPGTRRYYALARFIKKIPDCVDACGKRYSCARPENFVVMHDDVGAIRCRRHPAYRMAMDMIGSFRWEHGFPSPEGIGVLKLDEASRLDSGERPFAEWRTKPYIVQPRKRRGYRMIIKKHVRSGDPVGAVAALDKALREAPELRYRMSVRQGFSGSAFRERYASVRFFMRGRDRTPIYGLLSKATDRYFSACRIFAMARVDYRRFQVLEVSYPALDFPEFYGEKRFVRGAAIQRKALPSVRQGGVIRRAGYDSYRAFRRSILYKHNLSAAIRNCWGTDFTKCRAEANRRMSKAVLRDRDFLKGYQLALSHYEAAKRELYWLMNKRAGKLSAKQKTEITVALFRAMRQTGRVGYYLLRFSSGALSNVEKWHLALSSWYFYSSALRVLRKIDQGFIGSKKIKEGNQKTINAFLRYMRALFRKAPLATTDGFTNSNYANSFGVASVKYICVRLKSIWDSRRIYRDCMTVFRKIKRRSLGRVEDLVKGLTYDGLGKPVKIGMGDFYYNMVKTK